MRALELLNYLGALDDEGNLTEMGEREEERGEGRGGARSHCHVPVAGRAQSALRCVVCRWWWWWWWWHPRGQDG